MSLQINNIPIYKNEKQGDENKEFTPLFPSFKHSKTLSSKENARKTLISKTKSMLNNATTARSNAYVFPPLSLTPKKGQEIFQIKNSEKNIKSSVNKTNKTIYHFLSSQNRKTPQSNLMVKTNEVRGKPFITPEPVEEFLNESPDMNASRESTFLLLREPLPKLFLNKSICTSVNPHG
jgi:hypothetical protein